MAILLMLVGIFAIICSSFGIFMVCSCVPSMPNLTREQQHRLAVGAALIVVPAAVILLLLFGMMA